MRLLFIFMLLISFNASASLKVGDILLQPLHCWACSLIESQTKSEYSHIGVVIKIELDQVFVAEAFQKVKLVTLEDFMAKTQKRSSVKILRPSFVSPYLYQTFIDHYLGLNYDAGFLWNNTDELGEKIYCSELVYKLFSDLGMHTPRLDPMVFDVNRVHWERYFQGNIPDGELGISPEDFNQDDKYFLMGFISP